MLQIFGGKQGVGGQRAAKVHALAAQARQCRFDGVYFFMAQVATFAGVRIEAANQDARVGNAELVLQVGMQDPRDTLQAFAGDGVGNVTQGQVSRHQGHAQAAGCQHHHHLRGAGQVGEEFGMPRKGDAAFVDHALVHGGSDHPGEMPVQAALPGAGQGFQHERGVGLVQLACYHRVLQRRIPNIQAARGGGLVGEGVEAHRQQADGHAQLRGPLGEQVTAGNGNQGVWLGLRGEQQAQVRTYAGRLAGCEGEALRFHCAA
ncbi:hypothetical protein D3C81_1491850 [compost metagenome]